LTFLVIQLNSEERRQWHVILSEAKNLGSCNLSELQRAFVPCGSLENYVIPAQAGIHCV
jgi:hypothetical protein